MISIRTTQYLRLNNASIITNQKSQNTSSAIHAHPIFMLMDNHKLIQVLNTLNKKEWREFSKFVESPYFNTDKHCIRLLEILKREFAKKGDFQLSRTRLEKLFSKNNPADASLLNVKLSLLTRLAEQFFAQQTFEEKPLLFKHFLVRRLFERGLYSHLEGAYRRNSSLHEQPEKVSTEYYLYKHLLEGDFFEYTMASQKKIFLTHDNMQDANEALDTYYILKKTDLYNRMRIMERMFQKSYDLDSFKSIESIAMLPSYADSPIIRLYYTIYMLQQAPNSKNFNHLMKAIKQHVGILSPSHAQSFYITAANYCVSQIIKGEDYDEEIYDIYADIEKLGLLSIREWTDIRTLQNALMSGLRIKKFEWAARIIEKYKNKIKPDIREGTYNYFLALYAFYNKEFGKAVGYLLRASNVDFEFNMSIKAYLIKSYYEYDTEYSHHTEQAIRSFKVFFKQSKYFSKEAKDAHINFGNIINSLYRIKHHEGRATIEDVSKKMEQHEFLMYRIWLLEKIEELQNKPVRRAQY